MYRMRRCVARGRVSEGGIISWRKAGLTASTVDGFEQIQHFDLHAVGVESFEGIAHVACGRVVPVTESRRQDEDFHDLNPVALA